MSTKSKPLPSILAQMRNATRSISMANDSSSRFISSSSGTTINSNVSESRVLVESSSSSSSKNTSSYSKQASYAVSRLLNVLNSSGTRTNLKSSKKQKGSKFDQNFHVTVPHNFVIYTILVFIVLPLTIGSIFLIKQLLFGIVREDETHHLRKKEVVHLRPNTEVVVEDVSLNANATVNFVEMKTENHHGFTSTSISNSSRTIPKQSSDH